MAEIEKLPNNPYNLLKGLFRGLFLKINEIIDTINSNPTSNLKSYKALLSQTGTNAPTATILENSANLDLTYGYFGVGIFTISAPLESFPNAKTGVIINNGSGLNNLFRVSDTSLSLSTMTTLGVLANDKLGATLIEIYIKP
jgi:hypothetical protein